MRIAILCLLLVVGCNKLVTNEPKVPENLKIEQVIVLSEGGLHEYKGETFFVIRSFDNTVRVSKCEDPDKMEIIRQKIAQVDGVTAVDRRGGGQFSLSISKEDWEKNKAKIFDAFLE
jgi:hypothetical protein